MVARLSVRHTSKTATAMAQRASVTTSAVVLTAMATTNFKAAQAVSQAIDQPHQWVKAACQ
jgi:hypothetical protein